MYKKLLSFSILICFSLNLFAQTRYRPLRGECSAQSLIANKYEYKEEKYPIYLGVFHDSIDYVEEIELIVSPTVVEWNKCKTDCISPKAKDCFVWCLNEKPKEILKLVIVTDTTRIDNYNWKKFEIKELIEEGGEIDVIQREVICDYYITSDFYREVLKALIAKDYYSGSIEDFSPSEVKKIFHQYQKDNGHPFGQWTLETLDALEVKY